MSGDPPARIEAEILAAGGDPRLSIAEVRHAVNRAAIDTRPFAPFAPSAQKNALMQTRKRMQTHDANAQSFVPQMMTVGHKTSPKSLIASSPVAIPDANAAQTDLFLATLYSPDELLFCGNRTDAGIIGKNIMTAEQWRNRFPGNGTHTPPELFIINPLTGKVGRRQDGETSFRCSETVAVRKYFLVEFDAMPLIDQFRFWGGVIASCTLPLKSLTFSGSKSLHGIIELQIDNNLEQWRVAVDKILSCICNDKALPEYRADGACRNADRLSRLPGAWRMDKSFRQALLWITATSQQPHR